MIKIYGKPDCIFCDRAKALATKRGLEYMYYDVTISDGTKTEFRARFPEAKTVPQITVDGAYVGGFTELELHLLNDT